jgi:septum site-determining protein MinC
MEAFPRDAAMAETATSAFTRSRAAFDLKGVMTSLTVLRIRSRDLNLIERQLRAKVTQFPQMFHSAPLVLDVGDIEGGVRTFPLAALVRALQVCRVVPVAVTNIDDADRSVAMAAGLGVVSLNGARVVAEPDPAVHDSITRKVDRASIAMEHEDRTERTQLPTAGSQAGSNGHNGSARTRSEGTPRPERRPESAAGTPRPAPAAPPAPAAVAAARLPAPITHKPPLVIRQAVRSGQQIYAEKTDLIVLAPVNPGAQLIADGNIHVYAPLRGRAVAGAKGFTEARIFVQKLEAELCAISGAYLTYDDIPKDRMGKPAQLHLQDGKCVLSPL